jgi:hypothetical protein
MSVSEDAISSVEHGYDGLFMLIAGHFVFLPCAVLVVAEHDCHAAAPSLKTSLRAQLCQ